MIVKVDMYEKNGDNTIIELINIHKNNSVDASVYEIR